MSHPTPTVLHKGRLEALSDGVFAVVLTLLVLDLKLDHLPPHASDAEVWAALREIARPLIGYVFSFAIVALFWVLQNRKFSLLTHTTVRHAVWTFAFLFGVSLMPFSVSVYLRSMLSGAANVVYFANFAFIAAMLLGGWLDARRAGLVAATVDAATVRQLTRRLTAIVVGTVVATAVAYFQPSFAGFAFVIVVLALRRFTKS